MSTHIQPTNQPVYWGVTDASGAILLSDTCPMDGRVATPLTVYQDPDPNAYLGKVVGKGGTYNPLPAVGEPCDAGKIYSYNGNLIICRQSHNRTIYPPQDTPALWMVYRPDATGVLDWIAGEQVYTGTHRKYNNIEYVCLQSHVTQSDWTPPVAITLWQVYVPPPPPDSDWAYPVAYKIGDRVTYQGNTYRCLQAHTSQATWTPPAVPALWARV